MRRGKKARKKTRKQVRKRINALNYLPLILMVPFLGITGFVAVSLIGASVQLELNSVFTALVAIFLFGFIYRTIKSLMKYKRTIGKTFYQSLIAFLEYYRVELALSAIIYFLIIYKASLPSNIVLDMIYIFINALSAISIKLGNFLTQTFGQSFLVIAQIFDIVLQYVFIFLIIQTLAGFFRKRAQPSADAQSSPSSAT